MRMVVGDKAAGMVGSIAEVIPEAKHQRCTVHFCRNALAKAPKSKRPRVAAMLKAIHAMESREPSATKAKAEDPRCRHIPRRKIGPDVGDRPPEIHRRKRMGIAPLPGRAASQGVAVPTAS